MKKFSALAIVAVMSVASNAFAWTGPLCFSDNVSQVVITLREVHGWQIENPADIGISYEDNDGELALRDVRASEAPGEYDFVFAHTSEQSGIVGVSFSHPGSSMPLSYELEFRADPSDCSGAKISVE